MNEAQGPTETTPLCPSCHEALVQLLEDWHAMTDVLAPLVTERDRAHGHLIAVIDAWRRCERGDHTSV